MTLTDAELDALVRKYEMIREELRQQKKLGNQRVTRGLAVVGLILGYSAYADTPILLLLLPLVVSLIIALVTTSINELLVLSWKALELEKEIDLESFNHELRFGPINTNNQLSEFSKWYTVPWVIIMSIAVIISLLSLISPLLVPEIQEKLSPELTAVLLLGYLILFLFTGLSIISFFRTSKRIVESFNGNETGWFGVVSKLLTNS